MSLLTVRTVAEVRRHVAAARSSGKIIAVVPTMGALHTGHASLIEHARHDSSFVVVTIFVNPLQFGPNEDYSRYPRPLDKDLELCERMGADLVFAPEVEEIYTSSPQRTFVEVSHLGEYLCGMFRPGHFRGVTTVVAKLFDIVQPDRAYFGEKDFQQLRVIQRMVDDLNMPIAVVPVPTLRESDGLAMSSRNRYLSPEERAVAPALYRALLTARDLIQAGETNPEIIKANANLVLAEAAWRDQIREEYFEVVDSREVQPLEVIKGEVRIAAAIWIGKTRLIDNVAAVSPNPGAESS